FFVRRSLTSDVSDVTSFSKPRKRTTGSSALCCGCFAFSVGFSAGAIEDSALLKERRIVSSLRVITSRRWAIDNSDCVLCRCAITSGDTPNIKTAKTIKPEKRDFILNLRQNLLGEKENLLGIGFTFPAFGSPDLIK